jgi:hypothetical protein
MVSTFTVSTRRFSSFLGVNRKKLAQNEPKLVQNLVQLMDSSSLKVQCQAALALRNLASDGMLCFPPPNTDSLSPFREVPAGNRQGGRSDSAPSSPSINIPPSDPFCGCVCPQRFYPSYERVSDHRGGFLATVDQPLGIQGQ